MHTHTYEQHTTGTIRSFKFPLTGACDDDYQVHTLTLTHTHTHTHTPFWIFRFLYIHSLSLSLCLSYTHTYTGSFRSYIMSPSLHEGLPPLLCEFWRCVGSVWCERTGYCYCEKVCMCVCVCVCVHTFINNVCVYVCIDIKPKQCHGQKRY